jgi:hypothetical protein
MFMSWENVGFAVMIIFKVVLGGAEESTGGGLSSVSHFLSEIQIAIPLNTTQYIRTS